MYKRYIFFLYLFFFSLEVIAKPINFEGLNKLTNNDIQSITSTNINDDNLVLKDINIIIKELSFSDLIYDVNFDEYEDYFLIKIVESNLIENIFINNNVWIKDDLIIQSLISKENFFMTKNNLQKDIKVIRNIYKSKGFQDVSVIAKIEKFSQDRINLIYEIDEKNQQKS